MKMIISIIIVGIAITIVYLIILFFVYLKRRQDEGEANFQKWFNGKKIEIMDKSAFYVAKQSDGYSHFQGNGYLVLTEDELYFERRLVRKLIIIPLGSIVKVERTKRLAGKSVGKMILKVVFITQLVNKMMLLGK